MNLHAESGKYLIFDRIFDCGEYLFNGPISKANYRHNKEKILCTHHNVNAKIEELYSSNIQQLTFLISSSLRSLSSRLMAPVSPLRLGENLKAAAATPPPSSATPPAATAATEPSAPTVAAASVPEPGNSATLAAASPAPRPVSEDRRDLGIVLL